MKALMLSVFFAAGTMFVANAQRLTVEEVPEVVVKIFTDSNQTAQDVKWIKEGDNFRVKYEVGDQDVEAVYSATGARLSSIKEIKQEMLPDTILADIAKQFPDYKIDDIDEVTVGTVVTYRIELDGTPDAKAWYDSTGKFLRKVYEK